MLARRWFLLLTAWALFFGAGAVSRAEWNEQP